MKGVPVAIGFLALIGGCSRGAPFPEAALFDAAFSTPVNMSVQVDSNGQIYDPQAHAQCLLGHLTKAKGIEYAADTTKLPFYTLDFKSLPFNGNQVTLFSGSIKFDSSSNIEKYEREGNQYIASTVTYHVQSNAPFDTYFDKGFGPYTRRVVYVRDPAVGSWQVEVSSDDMSRQVGDVIFDAISQRGCPIEDIQKAKDSAYQSAMDQLERNISESGELANTSDSDILISKTHNIAVYTGIANQKLLDGVPPQNLTSSARALCEKTRKSQYHWRLPAPSDFNLFTRPAYGRQGVVEFVNTPDGRFWKGINRPDPNGTGDYFVLNSNEPPYKMPKQIFGTDGAMVETASPFVSGYARIICVADL